MVEKIEIARRDRDLCSRLRESVKTCGERERELSKLYSAVNLGALTRNLNRGVGIFFFCIRVGAIRKLARKKEFNRVEGKFYVLARR